MLTLHSAIARPATRRSPARLPRSDDGTE